jgi:hypothetical protein
MAAAESDLYGPALDAARAALRGMDESEVPAPLRRVAASSARRLPAPMAARLRGALESSEWLRGKALEAWEEADPNDPDPRSAASALLLRRPAGWEERVAAIRVAEAHRDRERRIAELERANAALAARLAEAEHRLEEERRRTEEARAAAAEFSAAGKAARRIDPAAGWQKRLHEAEGRLADATGERDELAAALTEADERIQTLRAKLRRAPRASRPGEAAGPALFGRGTPLELARTLDLLAEVVRTPAPAGRRKPPAPRFAFPVGVRPDRAEAINWLLAREEAVTVLLDGYNVAHELDPSPTGTTRRRVEHLAARLRRLAEGPRRVVVFWDSAAETDRRSVSGVEVQFVPSADAAIVEAARVLRGAVVVVSSDREVRERSEAAGARAVWGSALVEWEGR